jgi:hypothetical protein
VSDMVAAALVEAVVHPTSADSCPDNVANKPRDMIPQTAGSVGSICMSASIQIKRLLKAPKWPLSEPSTASVAVTQPTIKAQRQRIRRERVKSNGPVSVGARPSFGELHEVACDAPPLVFRINHQSVHRQDRNPHDRPLRFGPLGVLKFIEDERSYQRLSIVEAEVHGSCLNVCEECLVARINLIPLINSGPAHVSDAISK